MSPDGTAVFVSGNMLADDPDFFGGFAFVAEFTSEGKAKKASAWGNSAKNAATHLIIPTGVVENLPTPLEAQGGQILPFDSTSLGEDDAFTLWTQR